MKQSRWLSGNMDIIEFLILLFFDMTVNGIYPMVSHI